MAPVGEDTPIMAVIPTTEAILTMAVTPIMGAIPTMVGGEDTPIMAVIPTMGAIRTTIGVIRRLHQPLRRVQKVSNF